MKGRSASSWRRYSRIAGLCAGICLAPAALATVTVQQASNTSASVSYRVAYTGTPTYFRIYLDTDQRGGTGFNVGSIGAEYLVENGRLYKYSGSNGSWSWTYLQSVTYSNSGGIANVTISLANINNPQGINLVAQTEAPMDTSATVNQSLSTTPPPSSTVSVQASSTSTSASYRVTYTGTPTFVRVYLDTDQQAGSGFKLANIGADYLIENGGLYKYSGSNGSWNWTYLKSTTYSNGGGIANITVALADVNNPKGINLVAQTEAPLVNSATVTQVLGGSATPPPPPPPTTPPPTGGAIWVPPLGTSWQWQLTGTIDQTVNVTMYDIDLFDVDASVIASLHSQGRKVICYLSAGTFEDWRPDAGSFPASVLGSTNGWPGERWLDIRNLTLLGPIMKARLDLAVQKGCDGVEPDNVDGYTNQTGFPLTYANQIAYNRFMASEAHARNLSVALKNDIDQVVDLLPYFDWALNEQCFEYSECDTLVPFINAGKAVFNVEYNLSTSQFCAQANAMNFNSLKKNLNLDATRQACR
jgi:hypothetical protein